MHIMVSDLRDVQLPMTPFHWLCSHTRTHLASDDSHPTMAPVGVLLNHAPGGTSIVEQPTAKTKTKDLLKIY